MEIKNVKISNTSFESAPFDGIILHSNLKLKYDNIFDLDNVITDDVEGIVLTGDWHKRPLDFVECLKKVQEYKLGFFLDTKVSLEEFKLQLGIASFEKIKGYKLDKKKMSLADEPMIVFIGAILMDYYLTHTKYRVYSIEKDGGRLSTFELAKEDDIVGE